MNADSIPSPFAAAEGERDRASVAGENKRRDRGRRRFPIGAELQPNGTTDFRVWAPATSIMAVEVFSHKDQVTRTVPLEAEADGYFSGLVDVGVGTLYKFRTEAGSFADPASRYQPAGPHGPSEVIDERAFRWTDSVWRGRPREELVIYELHLGTFTAEGTWRAAMEQLPELRRLGITMIEVMPIGEFPGEFGWGYDGVGIFAPCRIYGRPDDARAFIDRAHDLGLMVILDVVYNHLGPDGNYLRQFSADYFSTTYRCEWGQAMNFDGPNAGPVREFFISNARYWVEEFHFDGLRLDATQQIFDRSPKNIIAEVSEAAQAAGADRQIYVVGENEPQDSNAVRPLPAGGFGLDALWNDDFHHSAIVAATGRSEAYYLDHRGMAQEFVSALKYGFLYQGQWYQWQKKRRGQPAFDLTPRDFVFFLQNHDQVANSLRGERLHRLASFAHVRALTAVLLLGPATPLLFQGQEFAASSPFLYFADHHPELRKLVGEGRRQFLAQFRTIASEECRSVLADPGDADVFRSCKLDFSERVKHQPVYRLHEDLLRLRREDPTLARYQRLDGAVLSEHAFVIRYFSEVNDDRLLVVNLGADLLRSSIPEPLLAPPQNRGWSLCWSSEAVGYGGSGTAPLETTAGWIIPGRAAVLLRPDEHAELPSAKLSEKD